MSEVVGDIRFSCIHCGEHMTAHADAAGNEIECTQCKRMVPAPPPTTGQPAQMSSSGAARAGRVVMSPRDFTLAFLAIGLGCWQVLGKIDGRAYAVVSVLGCGLVTFVYRMRLRQNIAVAIVAAIIIASIGTACYVKIRIEEQVKAVTPPVP